MSDIVPSLHIICLLAKQNTIYSTHFIALIPLTAISLISTIISLWGNATDTCAPHHNSTTQGNQTHRFHVHVHHVSHTQAAPLLVFVL